MIELENSQIAEVVCVCELVQVELEGTTLQGVVLWVNAEMLAY